MDVPEEIRIERVKNRSFQKLGNKMLFGGNLYKQEERFLIWSNPEPRIPLKNEYSL